MPLPSPAKPPNHYAAFGDGIHVTYSTTSIDGQPIFTYDDATHSKVFTGSQINRVDTELGTLVTVVIVLTVDSGSTSFTLLVPRVNLGASETVSVTTYGITAFHKFSIVPVPGQMDFYTPHLLQCTASNVLFLAPKKP